MIRVYPIYYHERNVGNAQVEKCGMFYVLHCHCGLTADKTYRIVASGVNKEVDLGICIPDETGIYLKKQLPIRSIGEEIIDFRVVKEHPENTWFPITENQSFDQLTVLPVATYCIKNGKPGLMVKKKE